MKPRAGDRFPWCFDSRLGEGSKPRQSNDRILNTDSLDLIIPNNFLRHFRYQVQLRRCWYNTETSSLLPWYSFCYIFYISTAVYSFHLEQRLLTDMSLTPNSATMIFNIGKKSVIEIGMWIRITEHDQKWKWERIERYLTGKLDCIINPPLFEQDSWVFRLK